MYQTQLAKLRQRIDSSQYRIKRTNEDKARKEGLLIAIRDTKTAAQIYEKVNEELKKIETDLYTYNNKKEEAALAGIYAGIYAAQSIIPESASIRLSITKETAKLVTVTDEDKDGSDVNLVEGSALRAMLSFFNRDNILENSEYDNFAIYDEPLATLSPETSSQLSVLFNIKGKTKQIILIEQKPESFANIENLTKFTFTKVEGKTLIKEG